MSKEARKETLKGLFGQAYSEDQDASTAERIPFHAWLASLEIGGDIANVTSLIGRALEIAPKITCQRNRKILSGHLCSLMGNQFPSTADELWASHKHRQTCSNTTCQRLGEIAHLDKYFTGEEIERLYGKEIDRLLKESV